MSKSNNKNKEPADYIPDFIRDEHRNIVYKKGAFFGKVRDALPYNFDRYRPLKKKCISYKFNFIIQYFLFIVQ